MPTCISAFWSLACCASIAAAQSPWVHSDQVPGDPPRELRAAWVASVANIDWPSAKTLTTREQQAELKGIAQTASNTHLNALFVQVRPVADALYPSTLEPWSEFLTGVQGKAPDPLYDPLALWVAECHARAIECHAWFNPFRTRHFEQTGSDAPSHANNAASELVHSYDRYKWFDPGEPAAQDRAIAAILDVVARYDIDGVHIDDYFYPYPVAGKPFPDDASWNAYQREGGSLSRQDWRRDNINRFVKRLYEEVKAKKPHLRVGISPFGIWRPGFPAGVEGYDAFDKLCADARLWLNQGTLDYAAPQLYWKLDAPKQPFGKLLDWWISQSSHQRPVFPGLYASKCDPNDGKWPPSEIVRQIELARTKPGSPGVVLFSVKALLRNYAGLRDALVAGPFARPALAPACDSCPAPLPTLSSACHTDASGRPSLTWTPPTDSLTVIVAWKHFQAWSYEILPAMAGGADGPPGATAAAIAPLARNNSLGAWQSFEPPQR